MDQTNIFSKFKNLPEEEQEALVAKYNKAVTLAMYQLIMTELKETDKEAFQETLEKQNDGDILLFGYQHIPDFENKYKSVLTAITDVFLDEIA